MATTLVNNNAQINQHAPRLIDAKLFSISGEDDETTDIENPPSKPPEMFLPTQISPDISMVTSSIRSKTPTSRSYKFVQLERALILSNVIQTNDDRIRFENEYLRSINENKFEEFIQKYYQKIHDYQQHIKQTQESKKERVFTFFDLEKNFLTLDPSRDIKIIFVDEPTSSIITKTSNTRSTVSAHHRSTLSAATTDAAIESFYSNHSHDLLSNPSRARDEIKSFARRAAERLHERLPRISSVQHRVKIIDDRDITGKPDERTLLQMKHKRALSLINKRRQLLLKMMTQSKKNQNKMEEQWKQTPLAIDNSAYCRELLERTNQIENVYREQSSRRPQTSISSRRMPNKNISSPVSSVITTTTTTNTNITQSSSIPFQDALSINQIEKTKNVRVLLPTRPLTAPMKANWVNYC